MRQRYSPRLAYPEPPGKKPEPPLAEGIALCVTALVLLLFGLAALYSTSFGIQGSASYYFVRQLQWGAIGLAGFAAVILAGYKKLSSLGWLFMILIVALLLAALCFSPVKGARRWIRLPGGISIQPSEYAKVVIALFMAKFCSDRINLIEKMPFRFILLSGLCCAPVIALVFAGRDMGTTVLLAVVMFAILYAAGVRLRYVLTLPPLGALALFLYIKYCSPFRWARLITYQDPELYQKTGGYQLWLSLLALGSGGWTGVGFGESRMKHKYLPEAHTDFILSIVGEELGFLWLCVVILGYMLFVLLAILVSVRARTRQGMFLAFGLTTFLAVQAIINIGVISGAFPTKGMPAPFISYGGSSLVTCLVATGLIVSVALDAAWPDYPKTLRAKIAAKLRRFRPFARKSDLENPES